MGSVLSKTSYLLGPCLLHLQQEGLRNDVSKMEGWEVPTLTYSPQNKQTEKTPRAMNSYKWKKTVQGKL